MARGRRAKRARGRRGRGRRNNLMVGALTRLTDAGNYAAGAGQINYTPTSFGMSEHATYKLVSATISICLRVKEATSGNALPPATSEFVYINLNHPAMTSDVIRQYGPFLIVTNKINTFRVRWPAHEPTKWSTDDLKKRTLLSIYDFGVNSSFGMGVVVHLNAVVGHNVGNSVTLAGLPVKARIYDNNMPPDSPFEHLELGSASSSAPTSPEGGSSLKTALQPVFRGGGTA